MALVVDERKMGMKHGDQLIPDGEMIENDEATRGALENGLNDGGLIYEERGVVTTAGDE